MELTFEKLPDAVAEILHRQEKTEALLIQLLQRNDLTQPEMLSIQKTASFLNLAVPTIYGLVSRREIPFSKKGKRLYFDRTELLEWIKTGKHKTKDDILSNPKEYIKRPKTINL